MSPKQADKVLCCLQALKIVDLYGKKNIDVSKQLYIKVYRYSQPTCKILADCCSCTRACVRQAETADFVGNTYAMHKVAMQAYNPKHALGCVKGVKHHNCKPTLQACFVSCRLPPRGKVSGRVSTCRSKASAAI